MGAEQKEVVVTQPTRQLFLDFFKYAWREHMGARNPGSVVEYERRAAVAARVEVWTQVLTHLGLSEEMGEIKSNSSIAILESDLESLVRINN